MLERFTPLARQVVVIASDQARVLEQACIGAEHILLALTHPQVGLASEILPSFGITHERVLERLRVATAGGDRHAAGQIPFSPTAIHVIHAADVEADGLKHNMLTPEHLLLGVLRQEEGIVVAILGALKVDVEAIRMAVVARAKTRAASIPARDPTERAVNSQCEGSTSALALGSGLAAAPDEIVRRALAAASSRAVSEARLEFGVIDLVVAMSGAAAGASGATCRVAADEPARRALDEAAALAVRDGRVEFTPADLIVSLRAFAAYADGPTGGWSDVRP